MTSDPTIFRRCLECKRITRPDGTVGPLTERESAEHAAGLFSFSDGFCSRPCRDAYAERNGFSKKGKKR